MKAATLLNLEKNTRLLIKTVDRDFFGIAKVTSKDIAGAFRSNSRPAAEEFNKKYESLIGSRDKPANEECLHETPFGNLRRDGDNKLTEHGQFDPNRQQKPKFDSTTIKQIFMPKDGQPPKIEESKLEVQTNNPPETDLKSIPHANEPYLISEVKPTKGLQEALQLFKRVDLGERFFRRDNLPPLSFVFAAVEETQPDRSNQHSPLAEEPRFPLKSNRFRSTATADAHDAAEAPRTGRTRTSDPAGVAITNQAASNESEDESMPPIDIKRIIFDKSLEVDEDPLEEPLEEPKDDFEFDKSIDEKFAVQKRAPRQASDYLKEIRAGQLEPTAKGLKHRSTKSAPIRALDSKVTLDSKGFYNYRHQVPNWDACRRAEILDYLSDQILYHSYDILAVNKPYGIASHGMNAKTDVHDMNGLIHELAASKFGIKKLHLAHRLDKNTTGVLLFATSEERARMLHKAFRSDSISKTYWCITKGTPDPAQGVVDIPIGYYTVATKTRSCVVPVDLAEELQIAKRYREARRAVTEYNVLAEASSTALVEVKPRSGVKHQIRVHLAFALNTPVLGDHKYSTVGKIAPQKLSSSTLKALHLRQQKVRTLPIHLHAKSVVISNAKANHDTLFITAPLPPHFQQNLKKLKLATEGLV